MVREAPLTHLIVCTLFVSVTKQPHFSGGRKDRLYLCAELVGAALLLFEM